MKNFTCVIIMDIHLEFFTEGGRYLSILLSHKQKFCVNLIAFWIL